MDITLCDALTPILVLHDKFAIKASHSITEELARLRSRREPKYSFSNPCESPPQAPPRSGPRYLDLDPPPPNSWPETLSQERQPPSRVRP